MSYFFCNIDSDAIYDIFLIDSDSVNIIFDSNSMQEYFEFHKKILNSIYPKKNDLKSNSSFCVVLDEKYYFIISKKVNNIKPDFTNVGKLITESAAMGYDLFNQLTLISWSFLNPANNPNKK